MADLTIDVSGWTQTEKNLVKAAVVALLHANSVTHSGVQVSLPDIHIEDPSVSVAALTGSVIKTKITDILAIAAADNVIQQAEEDEINSFISTSDLVSIKMAQIDTQINALSNVSDLKEFLRKLCKYIISTKR